MLIFGGISAPWLTAAGAVLVRGTTLQAGVRAAVALNPKPRNGTEPAPTQALLAAEQGVPVQAMKPGQ